MKNIYEDGTVPQGDGQKGNATPLQGEAANSPVSRPQKHAPLPPLVQQQQTQQAQQPQPMPYPPQGAPVYYTYIPVAPGQPLPQGAQVVMPQNMPQGAPQGFAAYPFGQIYYGAPQNVYPQAALQQTEPQTPSDPSAPDPGMRVLYQSEDFDSPISAEKLDPDPTISFEPRIILDETEDVSIEEVTIERPKDTAPPIQQVSLGVSVDDMEMSTFEFSAMAQHRHSTAKAIKQPGKNSGNTSSPAIQFEVEEMNEIAPPSLNEEKANGKRKISKFEIIRRIILGISVVAIVISCAILLNEYRLSKENDELEQGVSDLIVEVEPTTEKKEPASEKDDKNDKTTTESTTAPLTPDQQWAQIKSDYPNVIFPAGLQLKYAKLYAENSDFVGYLSADGVNLNLPIVQTTNDEYYLNKNFYGKTTKYGCPFVTHLNNIETLDLNTVIFGHHMNNGTVFGALDAYKSIEGFKKAPVITFNTLYKDYSWKVIAAFITNAYEEDDNGYIFRYYFTSLSTQERYSAYLNELSQRSLYDTGVDVLPTDKILTLSTCSHEFTDARFVVVARLVRDGESTDVDTSRATVNSNPRYPQAYYTKKGKTNPYKNASQWEVG